MRARPASLDLSHCAASTDRAGGAGRLLLILVGVSLYRVASWLMLDIDLFSDEAYYWTWAQQPDWGYYSKPPMIAWIIALTTYLLGDSELAVKAGAVLIVPLTTAVIWRIGREAFDARVALAAALLFFLMPGISMSQLVISTDVPLLLFWALSLRAWLRALQQGHWHWWIACGVAAGLGLLSKYNMALFAAAAFVHLLAERRLAELLRPRLWTAVAVAAALFAPNLAWNAAHGFPTLAHTAEISQLGAHGPRPVALLAFFGAQFGVFGPVSFGVLCMLALRRPPAVATAPQALVLRGLACFVFVPLGAILCQALVGQALANWAAPAYVAAPLWLAAYLRQRPRWLTAALAANVLVMGAAYHLPLIAQAAGHPLPRQLDPYARVRGWEDVGRRIAAIAQARPRSGLLFDERNVMAQALYYARPIRRARAWAPPQRRPRHHYQLVLPLTPADTAPLLYFACSGEREAVLAAFTRAERIGQVDMSASGCRQPAAVYRLEGFRGY